MTTLRDALAPYYSDPNQPFATPEARHKFELTFLGSRLNSVMNTAASDNAGWAFFNFFWRRFDGRDAADIYSPVHPDTLLAAASALGFVDVEPFAAWIESIKGPMTGKVQAISSGTSSAITLPYDSMPDTTFGDIQADMLAAGSFSENCVWHQLDDAYKLPSRADVELILANCPTSKMQYRANREDCDKYAQMFKAWLGYLGYGNIGVGYVEMTLIDSQGAVTGAHAVNSIRFVEQDGSRKAMLIEPQANALHDFKTPWVGAGINGMPVRQEVYFVVV